MGVLMITVYSKAGCVNCTKAKALLDDSQLEYQVIMVDQDAKALEYLINMGLRSMPQIFKDGVRFCDSYQGLLSMWQKGQL
jgi:glutaredoxin